ncbi:diketogulonate reductase-like aldo/keto reductase [Pseudochelatococcus lubricantis]|uniref:Diketogulonate reductase-like aldo/keto reductase n=1 Tax=Pseudochelatococcus lubricantis TaxID=1538102 RepID=A0ABX0V0B7_9HYPH|nr:aldo/keto reductase [Pseudochelatococcus lubricantis]NIJ58653.1 diketogulonate reductase-like aldo/keto reductase [Pseudochelatococcus lubricantis]
MGNQVVLPGGEAVPALGIGTWMMGERPGASREEAESVRLGVELGMTLVDTAEMYGDGACETFLGEALQGLRDGVFLVSKVYPHNASRAGVIDACERSLKRLRTDRLDLYLLHWRGGVPLEETVAGFEALIAAGKIRRWGVSNFDTDDMEELWNTPGGHACAVNQVLYNLTRRGPEWDLLPWLADHDVTLMAYSPIEQGGLPKGGALAEIAAKHGATPYQVALAWVLRRPQTIAIPKAARPAHMRENHGAAALRLDGEDFARLDRAFAPPSRKRPLEML